MSSRSAGRAVLALGGFLGSSFALLRLGRLDWMAVDWSDPLTWLATTDIEVALAALARLAGIALLAWIALTTVVYAAARLAGVAGGSIEWLSIGPFRRAIDALLAGCLALGSMAPAAAQVEPGPEPAPVATSQETVDPRYIPVPAGSPPAAEDADPPKPAEAAGAGEARVVVERGDHLWKLAEERLEEAWGRSPSDAEIAPYWRQVIEANRERIRSGDPDLIFPGEEIVLPPVPD